MAGNLNIHELAKEVVYDLRSKAGRERFVYDDGSANVSDDHQRVIVAGLEDGSIKQEDFDAALKGANASFADDLVNGRLDQSTLPEGEAEIADILEEIRSLGNEDLADSAQEFARTMLADEIYNSGVRSTGAYGERLAENKIAITTKASWTGGLQNAYLAIRDAVNKGDFDLEQHGNKWGLNRYIESDGVFGRDVKNAAKAFRGDVKEYRASVAPVLDANATLEAAAPTEQ